MIRIAYGCPPTLIGGPVLFVAVSIGVTVPGITWYTTVERRQVKDQQPDQEQRRERQARDEPAYDRG